MILNAAHRTVTRLTIRVGTGIMMGTLGSAALLPIEVKETDT